MNILKFFKFNFSKEQNKRIFKNFTSQIFFNSSLTIWQILFPPLMIMIYGLENFGIWIFLTAIPSTFAILNFELNEAAKTEMSIYFNQNNKNKVNEIFNNSIVLTFIFIAFLILITTLIINFYDFDLNILKDLKPNELKIILVCIFLSFYLNIINGIFKTGITYWGRLDVDTYIEIFFDFLTKLLIIVSGLVFKGLLFASFALVFASIFKLIAFYFFFLNYNQYLTLFSFRLLSKKQIVKLFKLSIPYYLESVTGVMKNSFQIIILGIFFNSQIVGLFSTLRTLFYFLPIRVWGITGKVLMYEFTKLYSEKKFDLLKKIYSKYLKLAAVFLTTFLFASMLFGEYIYNLWLNNSYNLDYFLLLFIIFEVSFYILATNINIVNRSINKFFQISFFQIIINLIVILISYLFFYYQKSYYFLFLFNLIGSILFMMYSVYFSRKQMRKELI